MDESLVGAAAVAGGDWTMGISTLRFMAEFPSTHASLLFRLDGRRDDPAWTRFVELYEPAIYQLARRRGLQDADCHEIVQNVLVRVSDSLPKFDPSNSGTFRAWLSRVARNLIIDDFRKRGRMETTLPAKEIHRRMDDRSADGFGPQSPEQELIRQLDVVLREQRFEQAAAAVRRQTGETNWLAFWRTCIEGQAIQDVADQLGLTAAAVYVARCRVQKNIRRRVEDHPE